MTSANPPSDLDTLVDEPVAAPVADRPVVSTVYAAFETDPELETLGIPLDYGDFKFAIARAGGANKKYARLVQKRMAPYLRQADAGVLDDDKAREVIVGCFADSVILDWEGVQDPQTGELMPFTRENCIKLFTDLPALFDDVREQSSKVSNFLKVTREDAAGN